MTTTLLPSLYLGEQDSPSTIFEDAKQGLLSEPKSLPPKYFYDEYGSALFDKICYTPEYYPTRTEDQLLAESSHKIMELSKAQHIVELGSGASRKTVHLFDAARHLQSSLGFWPFDVCEPIMLEAAQRFIDRYSQYEQTFNLTIQPLVGDYNTALDVLPPMQGNRLFVFLGGTIGNFTANHARVFLAHIRELLSDNDYFLLGLDRVKSSDILNAAYNDAEGITAAFNVNMLNVLNTELDANFDTAQFKHIAFFNEEKAQIEMHLESQLEQQVELKAIKETIFFVKHERMLTEISRKFSQASLSALCADVGLNIVEHFESQQNLYSLLLLRR